MKRLYVAMALMFAAPALLRAAGPDLPAFQLKEFLGRHWQQERVSYSLTDEQVKQLRGDVVLFDSAGKEILFQLNQASRKVYFIADLKPFSEERYSFKAGRPHFKTDLRLTRQPGIVEITNSRFGIRINKKLGEGDAPLRSWRLPSGKWAGRTFLATGSKIRTYEVSEIASGPVFAEFSCRVEFENGGIWEIEFELQAFEPLVKVRERFDCLSDRGTHRIVFNAGYNPNQILHRSGGTFNHQGVKMRLGFLLTKDFANVKKGTIFQLEPWLHWQHAKHRGTSFSLLGDETDALLFLATASPAKWVDPATAHTKRARSLVPLRKEQDGSLSLSFELKKGDREYLLGALSKDAVLSALYGKSYSKLARESEEEKLLDEPEEAFVPDGMKEDREKLLRKVLDTNDPLVHLEHEKRAQAPLPQKYQIKHSDFPLDRVKDFVLEWQRQNRSHPRILVTDSQLRSFEQNFKYTEKELNRLKRTPVTIYGLDDFIPMYLGTGNEQLEEKLVKAAIGMVQTQVRRQLNGSIVSVGVAPHSYQKRFPTVLNLVDSIFDSKLLKEQERHRMLAQIAFMGYMINSPAYWDASRGFGAMFINMHTTVAATRCAIAATLPDHPKFSDWMNTGMGYMKRQLLDKWADADGRWLGTHVEAPHYAMCSYDDILGVLLMANNTGASKEIFSDTVKNMGEWFAKISTPRDCRVMNWRHLPPIANTYKFEPSGIFGVLAGIYRETDPKFSAEMQWMQMQQGNHVQPGVGGFAAALSGYRRVIGNAGLPAKAPSYGSEWFNEAGVVLRNGYNTPWENMLYLIAGRGAVPHRHYDRDQGAITVWGKGQIISDDFGYCGCAPEEDQSMISSPSAGGIMKISDFTVGSSLDYVTGKKQAWRRQIMLVKGHSGNIPSYFVVHDSFNKPSQAIWRLWLSAEPVEIYGARMLVVGGKKDDKDEIDELLEEDVEDDILDTPTKKQPQNAKKSIYIGEKDILINGFNNIQTDIVFAALPPATAIKTQMKTKAPAGINSKGRYVGVTSTTQIGIILKSKRFLSLLTLIYPRPEREPPAAVRPIADGRGFEIVHTKGKDYIFLGESPLSFKDDKVFFEGSVGLARIIDKKILLDLPEPGKIRVGSKELIKERPKG